MARSRLEKIGTIFERLTGLLRSGAIRTEDKPIWYDVYKAFPPKLAPRYDRPAPNIQLKNIFYPEDAIRAKFQKQHKLLGTVNLSNSATSTVTQQFLTIYGRLKNDAMYTEEELYERAVEQLNAERAAPRQFVSEEQDVESLTNSFRQATGQSKQPLSTNIKDIFKA